MRGLSPTWILLAVFLSLFVFLFPGRLAVGNAEFGNYGLVGGMGSREDGEVRGVYVRGNVSHGTG